MTKSKLKPMTPGVSHSARVRAYAAGVVVTLGLCGVAYKAWALQVEDGDRYRALAERQHAMRVDIPAPRGEIVDTHDRPLAMSADTDSIWANPRDVHDVATTAEKLAALIQGDASTLESKLAGDRRFVWIARHVTPEIAAAVRKAKLPGIEVTREPRRWYPGKTVAGPVVGRADIDGIGLDGIELSMNEYLTGKRGVVKALRDARGRRMLEGGSIDQAEAGATVKLTLDRSIQAITDEALASAVIEKQAKNGVAVVLDVQTGRVLAMSSYPTYDPNGGDPHGARNRPVTDAYEAGSVMKVMTVAAALEEGVVTPDTGFVIGPAYKVGPKSFTDTHEAPYLSVADIIKVSSNIGAVKIGMRLGGEKLHGYLRKFGFGAKTGIEMPGEQTGKMRNGSTWREIELATISFGYGITITPLQLAAALAAIGNKGVYHAPRIVDQVVDADGVVLYHGESEARQMISAKTAEQMRVMLARVFDKALVKEGHGPDSLAGTAQAIIVQGFKCGGKTGTAHKYDPAIKGYSPHHYLSSFAGLAPIDNPRLAIVVMVDDPVGGDYYGGKVAGPVFAKVASEALRYLGVPGDAEIPLGPNGKPLPPPKPEKVKAVKVAIHDAEPEPAPVEEPVVEEAPDPAAIEIPDFTGMGVGRAIDEARKLHLEVDVTGSGQEIAQEPAPGRTATATRMKLTFSDDARRISPR